MLFQAYFFSIVRRFIRNYLLISSWFPAANMIKWVRGHVGGETGVHPHAQVTIGEKLEKKRRKRNKREGRGYFLEKKCMFYLDRLRIKLIFTFYEDRFRTFVGWVTHVEREGWHMSKGRLRCSHHCGVYNKCHYDWYKLEIRRSRGPKPSRAATSVGNFWDHMDIKRRENVSVCNQLWGVLSHLIIYFMSSNFGLCNVGPHKRCRTYMGFDNREPIVSWPMIFVLSKSYLPNTKFL